MKQNPSEAAIRERMQPGVLSRDGFLGKDNRTIGEIVNEDIAVVLRAGLTLEDLADLLDDIHRALEGTQGMRRALYGGTIEAREDEAMGGIVCPFGCGHRSHKAIITISMPGRELVVTALHGHMIREHGFFEGKGAVFRLEPHDLIDLYRLCRGVE